MALLAPSSVAFLQSWGYFSWGAGARWTQGQRGEGKMWVSGLSVRCRGAFVSTACRAVT
jgi:hypothetical protein